MVAAGTIAAEDLKLLLFTDSVEEAMAHIQTHAVEKFGLVRKGQPVRSRILGEGPAGHAMPSPRRDS